MNVFRWIPKGLWLILRIRRRLVATVSRAMLWVCKTTVSKVASLYNGRVNRPKLEEIRGWLRKADTIPTQGKWKATLLIAATVAFSGVVSLHDLERAFSLAITPLAVLWGFQYLPTATVGKEQSLQENLTALAKAARFSGIVAVVAILIFTTIPHEPYRFSLSGSVIIFDWRMWLAPLVILLIGAAVSTAMTGLFDTARSAVANNEADDTVHSEIQEKRQQRLGQKHRKVELLDLMAMLVLFPLILLVWFYVSLWAYRLIVRLAIWTQDSEIMVSILIPVIQVVRAMGPDFISSLSIFSALIFGCMWVVLYQWISMVKGNYIWIGQNVTVREKGKRRHSSLGWRISLVRSLISPLNLFVVPFTLGLAAFGLWDSDWDRRGMITSFWAAVVLIVPLLGNHNGQGINDIIAGTEVVLIEDDQQTVSNS